MEDVPVRRLGRAEGLDGVRGVAVIIVFISHLDVILPIPRVIVIPGGTVSIDSFFVLSGFLITTLLLREQALTGRINTLHFYRRRALRLLPALGALLIAHAIFAYLSGISYHDEWTSLLSVMFYYSNWKLAYNSNALGGHIAPGLQHLWSLSVEEQFYLVWPWVTIFVLTYRRRLRTVVIVLVTLIVAVTVHRALAYHGIATWYGIFIRTDTRADGILIGCLLSHIWFRRREPKRGVRLAGWLAIGFLLVCLPLVDSTSPFIFRGGLLAIDIACALVVLALVSSDWGARHFFSWRPFVVLGTVSYGLYLWHLPVFFAIHYYGHSWNEVLRVVVAIFATLLFTTLSWCLLEKPALDWKDRLEGRQPGPSFNIKSLFSRPAPTIGGESLAATSGSSVNLGS
jgi:peptidoglycan/LPS O-acetylase OafA/YrhL